MTLAAFTLLFYRAGTAFKFDSDTHILTNVLSHFDAANDEIYLPGHTFANKIPFVLLLLRVFGNTHLFYSLVNLGCAFGWLIPTAAIVIYFQRRDRSLPVRLLLFILPLMTSTFFNRVTSSATVRNAEYGLAYLMLFLAVVYATAVERRQKRWIPPALAFLTYTLIISDEFFLTGYSLPIIGLSILLWLRRGTDGANLLWKRSLVVALVTIVTTALALLTISFFKTWPQSPIHIAPNSDFLMNTYEGLAKSNGLAVRGMMDYLGAEFWGQPLSMTAVAQAVTVVIGILALVGALSMLLRVVIGFGREKAGLHMRTSKELFLLLVTVSFVLTYAAYVATNFASDALSTRYLSVLPIFVGTFSALAPRFPYRKDFAGLVVALCLPVLFINYARIETNLERLAPRMDYYDALSTIIEQDNLKVGYSGYWNAFSTASLTRADDIIIPVLDCRPMTYVGTKSLFAMKPDFILVDRNGVDKPYWQNCSDAQLTALYGPAKSTQTLMKGNETIEMWILK